MELQSDCAVMANEAAQFSYSQCITRPGFQYPEHVLQAMVGHLYALIVQAVCRGEKQ